jgi:predicted nucleotidyltransferase
MSEVVFHRLDLEAALAALRRYARTELGPRPEVREVVLIGSLARGDWSARSDADIVVIVDSAGDRGPFRSQVYAPRAARRRVRLHAGGAKRVVAALRRRGRR